MKMPAWIRQIDPARVSIEKNADGFTFEVWLKQAGVPVTMPTQLWYQRALAAWRANDNPAEWAERGGAPKNRWKLEGYHRV